MAAVADPLLRFAVVFVLVSHHKPAFVIGPAA